MNVAAARPARIVQAPAVSRGVLRDVMLRSGVRPEDLQP